jgi:hypothetical protein
LASWPATARCPTPLTVLSNEFSSIVGTRSSSAPARCFCGVECAC